MDRYLSKSYINKKQDLFNKQLFWSQDTHKEISVVPDVSFHFPITQNSFKNLDTCFFDYNKTTYQSIFCTEKFFTTFNISDGNCFQVNFQVKTQDNIQSVCWVVNQIVAYSLQKTAYIFDTAKGQIFREIKAIEKSQEICCIQSGQQSNQFSNSIFCIGDNNGQVLLYDLRQKNSMIACVKMPKQDLTKQIKFYNNFFGVITENIHFGYNSKQDINKGNINIFDIRNTRTPFQKVLEKNVVYNMEWYREHQFFFAVRRNNTNTIKKKIFSKSNEFVLMDNFNHQILLQEQNMLLIFKHDDLDTILEVYCTKNYTLVSSFKLCEVTKLKYQQFYVLKDILLGSN